MNNVLKIDGSTYFKNSVKINCKWLLYIFCIFRMYMITFDVIMCKLGVKSIMVRQKETKE